MASDSFSIMPSSFAIATAVSLWSPVIITVRIPASLHSSIAGLTSGRTGSIIPVKPTKHKSFSIFSGFSSSEPSTAGIVSQDLVAAESTLRALPAISLFASKISLRTWSVRGFSFSPSQ